ncbi:ABC transporter permease [Paenibacillus sp. DMB20]|uniref:ABC transporter permease n=1 Tax=Paenibacillus sp. DMB20 TaxID=1642570 RepID=UPI000627C13F|nr:ABC transporter permease [Paenibacillus sp. DMB20]KKO54484.1 ABC transporter permease [Paenibacillus sp. DMB20]
MRMIRLEFYKLRRKRLLLMTVLFLCAEIVWAFAAAGMSFSRHPGRAGWEPVIVMLSSMNGLFLPILSAIVVSRICDMEHKGNTWKLLLSASVRRGQLYAAKYICACLIMLCACLLQVLAIAAFGVMNDFIEPVPIFLLVRFLIGVAVTNMVVIALQQWMSMAVKNQAFALCLGMLGGFIGLVGDLFPATVRRFFAWTYYTGLSPITQKYASEEMQLIVRDWGEALPVTGMLIAAGFAIYAAGSLHVSRQEV